MGTFESKVSEIFNENPRLARKTAVAVRQIFQESEAQFKKRLRNETEEKQDQAMMRLFDTLFMDFHYNELEGRFMDWVIENYSDRFEEIELEEMRAQAESHLDFYEILEVRPGRGSFIKSLCTEREFFLKDISSSSHLVKWDIVMVRCYLFDEDFYATGSLMVLGPQNKKYILDRIKKAFASENEFSGSSCYAAFAKERWEIFYKIEREIHERERNKKFYTKFGELQFCEVRFQVKDIQAIIAKINLCEEFNFIETKMRRAGKKKKDITRYKYDWLSLGIEEELDAVKSEDMENGIILSTSQLDIDGNQMGIELLGEVYVDKLLCRLETRSVELAEFAAQHFKALFGDLIKFKRIVKKKMDSGSKDKGGEEPSETERPASIEPGLARKIEEDYYLSQLDENVPALNNMTPREARRDPDTLPLLIDWLKGLENLHQRNSRKGENFIPLVKIKKKLDIDW